jgi:hypothetical protein
MKAAVVQKSSAENFPEFGMSSSSFWVHIVQSLPGTIGVPHEYEQLVALLPLLNSPVGQGLHVRSIVADGVFDTKVSTPQMVIAVHSLALDVVLKVSLAHKEQLRSAMVVPSEEMKVPGEHVVFATHGVAAFWSWSQVSTAQATFGLVSPAQ